MRTRTYRSLVTLGGGLGLIASIYAALEVYYASLAGACSITAYVNCGKILNSGKTTTLGISDWIWGVAGFVVILALAILTEQYRRDPRLPYVLLTVTTAGIGLSVYFLYVEVVEIHGLCPVCAAAYLCGVIAWVGAIGLARKTYRREHRTPTAAVAEA
ncbi:MAG TPA: vitamin K epoxide reductase family protein [Thermoplasmata archaeon]|nr:vitamin K epoxide reductase family protein [Thermoplasmata archaeon]